MAPQEHAAAGKTIAFHPSFHFGQWMYCCSAQLLEYLSPECCGDAGLEKSQ